MIQQEPRKDFDILSASVMRPKDKANQHKVYELEGKPASSLDLTTDLPECSEGCAWCMHDGLLVQQVVLPRGQYPGFEVNEESAALRPLCREDQALIRRHPGKNLSGLKLPSGHTVPESRGNFIWVAAGDRLAFRHRQNMIQEDSPIQAGQFSPPFLPAMALKWLKDKTRVLGRMLGKTLNPKPPADQGTRTGRLLSIAHGTCLLALAAAIGASAGNMLYAAHLYYHTENFGTATIHWLVGLSGVIFIPYIWSATDSLAARIRKPKPAYDHED